MHRIVYPAASLLAVVVVVLAGVLNPPRTAAVLTDRLGPDHGEQVGDYLARARLSLVEGRETHPRWALVSLATEVTPVQVPDLAVGVRVSQVLYRVPLLRVQTTLRTISVPDDAQALQDSADLAASQLAAVASPDPRTRATDTVSAARLRAGCACVVGLTVRGTAAQLTEVAARQGVRAVEALPADAVFGQFAISPLLPEQLAVVAPGPDDGDVPPN